MTYEEKLVSDFIKVFEKYSELSLAEVVDDICNIKITRIPGLPATRLTFSLYESVINGVFPGKVIGTDDRLYVAAPLFDPDVDDVVNRLRDDLAKYESNLLKYFINNHSKIHRGFTLSNYSILHDAYTDRTYLDLDVYTDFKLHDFSNPEKWIINREYEYVPYKPWSVTINDEIASEKRVDHQVTFHNVK